MRDLLQYKKHLLLVSRRAVQSRMSLILIAVGFALLSTAASRAQSTGDPTPNALDLGPRCPTCPIVIASRPLSEKDKEDRSAHTSQKKDYSIANAKRKLYIDDETNKMLILARDLKAKIDGLGSERPSAIMLREAAVIEFLAKDIKEKMKLTVNPD
ncbi:hypothetical protein [Occallatibacter savannae]|uniref:hypothetical protein n=1 Tax=Occallatibacter savannae TaxID=1002691 RepID=UPI0013A57A10|nr:hypothetical protein [Occallatibacter savannae]